MSDCNAMRDSVAVELNAPPSRSTGSIVQFGARPRRRAPLLEWVDYCVALGAHRELVASYKRPELIDIADRLGG